MVSELWPSSKTLMLMSSAEPETSLFFKLKRCFDVQTVLMNID